MSDIFREVDEDLRREQVKKLWDRFAPVRHRAGGADRRGDRRLSRLGVLAGAPGAGDRRPFPRGLHLSADGKHDEAIAALEAIARDGSGGYPVLARFRVAAEKAQAGDKAGAVAEFDAIAAGKRLGRSQDLARLRAALLLVDTASVADLQARIGDLAAPATSGATRARNARSRRLAGGRLRHRRKYFEDIASTRKRRRTFASAPN